MSILEELFFGNIQPDVTYLNENSVLAKLDSLNEKNKEKLLSVLSESEKEILGKFLDSQDELECNYRIQKFKCGFRLGVLMMCEVFNGEGVATV